MQQIIKSTIEIGLEKPVKLLHVTDTHLSYADERDNERKQKLAISRQDYAFHDTPDERILKSFLEQIKYANENCDLLVHTGDLIDFISVQNLEKARWAMEQSKNFFMIAGNHEFSRYVGEAWEDTAYKMNPPTFGQVQRGLGCDLLFAARQVGGVNIVGIDNGYYQVEDWQTERLKQEVQKGLPVILMMHNPLYEESLYQHIMKGGAKSTGLVGCDEEHLLPYEEYRAMQQRPAKTTMKFVEYVLSEPAIKAVLTGHLHFSFESRLPNGVVQYITGGGYDDVAREITIV